MLPPELMSRAHHNHNHNHNHNQQQKPPPKPLPIAPPLPPPLPLLPAPAPPPPSHVPAHGIDPTKIQLPCANCKAILNVPHGLARFNYPQCSVDLAVDVSKLKQFYPPPLPLQPPPPPPPEELNEVAIEVEREEDEGGMTGEKFTDYRPPKLSIGPLHPDPVVETSSLSAVQPPEPTYDLEIRDELETTKALSCLLIETLVYACQRHLRQLPSGARAGFFIGDGAGVGKGRTIAGLIWENWHRGRRKALWNSVGSGLKFDARRDLDDVGATRVEEEKQKDGLSSSHHGFYESKREWLGRRHFILAFESSASGLYKIVRPAVGESLRDMAFAELKSKYRKISPIEKARSGSEAEYGISSKQCMHGPNCMLGNFCTVGGRQQEVNVLGGLILPVWGTIEKALSKKARQSRKRLRVVRIETTTDNQRIVGLFIPNGPVETVLQDLAKVQDIDDRHEEGRFRLIKWVIGCLLEK